MKKARTRGPAKSRAPSGRKATPPAPAPRLLGVEDTFLGDGRPFTYQTVERYYLECAFLRAVASSENWSTPQYHDTVFRLAVFLASRRSEDVVLYDGPLCGRSGDHAMVLYSTVGVDQLVRVLDHRRFDVLHDGYGPTYLQAAQDGVITRMALLWVLPGLLRLLRELFEAHKALEHWNWDAEVDGLDPRLEPVAMLSWLSSTIESMEAERVVTEVMES